MFDPPIRYMGEMDYASCGRSGGAAWSPRQRSLLVEAGNPEHLVLDQIMDSVVRESLEALPLQYRSTVLLTDVQGFSYKEIADILGIPVGTVQSRLSRGRHTLQRKLWDTARTRHFGTGDRL